MKAQVLLPFAFAVTALTLALTGEAAGEDQWRAVTSPDSSFTVEMPGELHYFREELPGAKGPPVILHQYLVELEQGKEVYIAQGAAYTDDFGISDPKSFLERSLAKAAEKLDGGRWTSVQWGTQQGALTVEATGVAGQDDRRTFSAVEGTNGIDLVYWGPRNSATSPDANRFFSSLKIAERPASHEPQP